MSDSQAIAGIKAAEQYVSLLLDSAADAIITSGPDSIIRSFNASACKMFGYTPDEVIGKPLSILMPPHDASRHDQYVDNYMGGGSAKIIGIGRDLSAIKKNKDTFPIYLSIAEMKFEKEIRFVGIIRDLSALRQAQDTMKAQAEKLKAHNTELQQFVYVASHDLQEPLRKILAFGDRLKSVLGDTLDERGALYLERMLGSADRMKTLINDLLGLSRVHTLGNTFEKISLAAILQDVLSDLEILINETHATIHVGEMPIIAADPSQMRQLFQNLISNAIKFQEKNVLPVIKITADLLTAGGSFGVVHKCRIEVADNGIGMEQIYEHKIFEPFQRLHGRGEFPGSGIGLAICHSIVRRHNGSIWVESAPGKGATFKIELPIEK